jgi:DNA-binding protein HU-beta
MNQSELIEKVAQAAELNHAVAGHAVKAAVNAILDALLAGEPVRVSGLGIFNVASRPARQGRNSQTGETIEIAASKVVRFNAGKAVKRCPQPADFEGGSPEEVCTNKEIRGADVNLLSLRRITFETVTAHLW